MNLNELFGRKRANSQALGGGGQEIATQPVAARNDKSLEKVVKAVDSAKLQEANQILQEYKAGKKNLEQRVIANEQWYKLRHWDYIRGKEQRQSLLPAGCLMPLPASTQI